MCAMDNIISVAKNPMLWLEFLAYKKEKQHISTQEEKEIEEYVYNKRFEFYCDLLEKNYFPIEIPEKKMINKGGTGKKRVVYTFNDETVIFLKFIAFQLYKYDDYFMDNCYAFRRSCGVGDAIKRLKANKDIKKSYCLKMDISNYFNSIDVNRLLVKLEFIKQNDTRLYELFERILSQEFVFDNGVAVKDYHGAMAGMPLSPFFANVYLSNVDRKFMELGVEYYRYSDDILIFAETDELLNEYKKILMQMICDEGLTINPDKTQEIMPGEKIEFLGFYYEKGSIGISANAVMKVKRKIKRKSDALRRWQRKKGLSEDKAAKGFIRAINRIFYGRENESEFTWCRWFFPYITTVNELKEIDSYVQEYIRYTVTGRHYKGNYKISYQQLKNWGYRNLVNEYYNSKQNLNLTIKALETQDK